MRKLARIYPVLFAVAPVLFLYSHNMGLVALSQIWMPTAVVVAFALLLWLCSYLVVKRDAIKAGCVSSLFLFSFFTYGHLFHFMGPLSLAGVGLAQHKYVFPAWTLTVALAMILLVRTRKNLLCFSDFLSLVATLLLAFAIANILLRSAGGSSLNAELHTSGNHKDNPGSYPDIYYIVLDGCSRADVLKATYQLDISEFLGRLQNRGFYIAGKSTANYSQTYLSLASSLNFIYLDDLAGRLGPESDDRLPLRQLIQDNRVVSFLRDRGYVFASFASGMNFTEIKTADRYLAGQQGLSEFDNLLLSLTPVPALVNKLFFNSSGYQYDSHRSRILYALHHLKDIAKIDAPTFAFVHLLACHPPYVFGAHGEAINPKRDFSLDDGNFFIGQAGRETYLAGYRNQLIFILDELEEALDEVLSNSQADPVLILQADHGGGSGLDFESLADTDLWERMAIFNAYYLPEGGSESLYPGITPVNTFRVIFDVYFDAGLELLEDRNFYSTLSEPYRLTDVTDHIEH